MTLELWARGLVVLAGLGWVSTAMLVISSARLREPALQERAFSAVLFSFASSIFALLAVFYLQHWSLPAQTYTSLLVLIAILTNVPQIIWVALLLTGRFR